MKKKIYISWLVSMAICLVFSCLFSARAIAAGKDDALHWYLKNNDTHDQPSIDPAQSRIEKYNGYYVDKRCGKTSEDKVLYLTFDAGYENGNVAKILDVLKEEQVPAAFFVLKNIVLKQEVLLKRMVKEANPLQAFLDGKHFMNTAFVMLFAVNILMNFANTGFDQVFNYYLKDQLGLTSAYNGIIKAAVGLISFVFNMSLCLWIIRRTDTKVSITVLMGLCALASVGTVLTPQIGLFIGLSVFVYAGYSVSLPVLQHMVAIQADPAQKNLVMGFYNATKSLGSIIGSLMAGFLYALHVKLPFAVVAVAYGCSLLAAMGYLLHSRKK